MLPFLRNIETVVITEDDIDRVDCCALLSCYTCRTRLARLAFDPSINDFIDTIVANAVKFKSIETLVLNDCHIREPDGFVAFMEEKPNILKSFSWIHSSVDGISSTPYELVEKHIPGIAYLMCTLILEEY